MIFDERDAMVLIRVVAGLNKRMKNEGKDGVVGCEMTLRCTGSLQFVGEARLRRGDDRAKLGVGGWADQKPRLWIGF